MILLIKWIDKNHNDDFLLLLQLIYLDNIKCVFHKQGIYSLFSYICLSDLVQTDILSFTFICYGFVDGELWLFESNTISCCFVNFEQQ